MADHELARAIVAIARERPVAIDDVGIFKVRVGPLEVNAQRVRITGGMAWVVWQTGADTQIVHTTPERTIAQMCLTIRCLCNSMSQDEQDKHVKKNEIQVLTYKDMPIGEVMLFYYQDMPCVDEARG